MNLINELNILLPKLDSKQKEFVENYIDEFQKIEERILSSNSFVGIEKSYLVIFLEHISDQNTWIEIKVERREIYITVVGFGFSMWQVAKGKGTEFKNGVREFINSALESGYKKIQFYDKSGQLVKEKLTWNKKPELEAISVYGTPRKLITKWFINKFQRDQYQTSEINFSKFI